MVCEKCEFRRGMINRKHGVKIPGGSGKCTRTGGLCGEKLLEMVTGGTGQVEIMRVFGFANIAELKTAYARALTQPSDVKLNHNGAKGKKMKSSLFERTDRTGLDGSDGALVPDVLDGVPVGPLTDEENRLLAACEKDIRENMVGAFKFGMAIITISSRRLHRATHERLYDYMRERFDIEKSRVHQLMNAAKVYDNLHNCGVLITPANEAQARPLTVLPEADQVGVWQSVVETAPGGNVTAKMVAAAVAEHLGKKKSQRARTIQDGANNDPALPEDLQTFITDLVTRARAIQDKDQRAAMRKYLEGVLVLLKD